MNYAIIIGIDHYKESPLSGAVADADAFANFLTSKNLICNTDNLKLLKSDINNSVVSGPEIDKAIEEVVIHARANGEANNRLYFYFSGHGIGNTFFNTALCLRYWGSTFINHCISCQDYQTGLINKGIFDELLIFLDCCREHDTTIEGSSPIIDWKNRVGDLNPKILICNSTIYGKYSYEVDVEAGADKKRGAFTSFLIQALNGDADRKNTGQITAYDLRSHIDDNFEAYAKNKGKYQKAQVDPSNGGDTIVICNVEKLVTDYNCQITFRRNSNITLKGRDTKVVKIADVKEGDTWQCKLEQGFSVLIDNNTNEIKLIENYSENTISYVDF